MPAAYTHSSQQLKVVKALYFSPLSKTRKEVEKGQVYWSCDHTRGIITLQRHYSQPSEDNELQVAEREKAW